MGVKKVFLTWDDINRLLDIIHEKSKGEIVDGAKTESEKVVQQAKEKIQNEKEKMLTEIKKEIGTLVVAATTKIVEEGVDEEKSG